MRSSEATHAKLLQALSQLECYPESHGGALVRLLLEGEPLPLCDAVSAAAGPALAPFNPRLNESQMQAVAHALQASRLSLVSRSEQ
jgi:hypothetical protein